MRVLSFALFPDLLGSKKQRRQQDLRGRMIKIIHVVGAVITESRDNCPHIFATRRGPGKPMAGYWEFPGGKIESGETVRGALVREIQEELGCTISVGDEVTITEYTYDFGTIRLTTHWSTLADGRPTLTEHSEARWLSAEDLESVEWAPADIPAVKLIIEQLS